MLMAKTKSIHLLQTTHEHINKFNDYQSNKKKYCHEKNENKCYFQFFVLFFVFD